MRTALYATGLVSLFLLALVGTGCKSDSSNPYGAPTSPSPYIPPSPLSTSPNTVSLSGSAFNPATITVSVGTTVTWKNDDSYTHTSTSDTGVWDSGNIAGGATASAKFNTAGTFPYHCIYHGPMGMKGTVIVQ